MSISERYRYTFRGDVRPKFLVALYLSVKLFRIRSCIFIVIIVFLFFSSRLLVFLAIYFSVLLFFVDSAHTVDVLLPLFSLLSLLIPFALSFLDLAVSFFNVFTNNVDSFHACFPRLRRQRDSHHYCRA